MADEKDLSEEQLAILMRGVTLARNSSGFDRLSALKAQLVEEGSSQEDVDAAMKVWADYVRTTNTRESLRHI